jgi:hypothetical protein
MQNRQSLSRAAFAVAVLACAFYAQGATAQTVPAEMIMGGRISAGVGAPTPAKGDAVDAVDPATGTVLGSGTIEDGSGNYSITLTKPASLNGSIMTLRLVNGCTTYQLVQSGASAAPAVRLTFNGSFPFPTTLTLNPTIGAAVSSTGCPTPTAAAAGTVKTTADKQATAAAPTVAAKVRCPSIAPHCDVAGVGMFDQRAIEAMKACLAVAHPGPNCDVNGDGVVDTRDLIDLLRAWAQFQREQSNPTASVAAQADQAAVSAPLSGVKEQ